MKVSAETGAAEKMGYRPELDGLRGIAVALVVVGHAFHERVPLIASYAVEMFFVLSGFLITSILLEERESTGRVSLREFYERRARRLLPALVLVLAVVGAWGVLVDRSWLGGVMGGATYSSNWLEVLGWRLEPMHHLWSLAVEEHFYLLWPVVLVGVGSTRGVLRVALVGAVASLLWRWWLISDGVFDHYRVGVGTDTRASALLAGAALAAGWRLGWRPDTRAVGAAIVAAVLVLQPERLQWGFLACTVGTCLLIVGAVSHGAGWLRWSPIAWLGGISYALYLWHSPVMMSVQDRPHVTIPVSVAIAWVSTRYMESRWRLRQDRDGGGFDGVAGSERERGVVADRERVAIEGEPEQGRVVDLACARAPFTG